MKKFIIAVLILLCVLGGAYVAINRLPYADVPGTEVPERGTLSGTYVCLPLRDASLTTADCAVGVLSDDGLYYAIDFGFYAQGMPQLVEGDHLSAQGIITPIETLSTDYWRKYPVVGIFSVTDSLHIEPQQEMIVASTTLTSNRWVWQKTTLGDGSVVEASEEKFVLSFLADFSYQSTTDCNSLSGTYVVDGEVLSLASPAMTKMFCEGSIEHEYVAQLVLTSSYSIEGDTLRLLLGGDYGVMEFKAQ